jgi:membrane associated rhomboid family serine protease
MANVHGFHNLGPRPSEPSSVNQGNNRGYVNNNPYAQSQPGYGQQRYMVSYGQQEEEGMGISLLQPKPSPDGGPPGLCQMFFPRITWKAVTTVVVLLDWLLFIITLIVGAAKYDGAFVKSNSFGGPSGHTLCAMGGKWFPSIRYGHIWRLFTANLLHAGFVHICSNTFFTLKFGYVTEARWGIGRWLAIYILTGISGNLWSTDLKPGSVSIGASAALFGIVGADFTYLIYNWNRIPQNKLELCFITVITVINFLLGLGSSIDNYAHLGGLIGGLALGIAIPPHLEPRDKEVFFRGFAAFVFFALTLLFLLLVYVGNPDEGLWDALKMVGYSGDCLGT